MCARQARAQVEPPGFEPPLELSPVYADNSSILALLRHNTSSHTIFKTDYIGFFQNRLYRFYIRISSLPPMYINIHLSNKKRFIGMFVKNRYTA